MSMCDSCAFYTYDEEYEEYSCDAEIDEDEYARLIQGRESCPYWRNGDEYAVVRHQM